MPIVPHLFLLFFFIDTFKPELHEGLTVVWSEVCFKGRTDKNPFIHLINIYYTSSILGTDDKAVNKMNKTPAPKALTFLGQSDDGSKVNIYYARTQS